jgi:hypothetical protein
VQDAETSLSKAIDANGYNQMAGVLSIAKGDYIQAEKYLEGINSNSSALAKLLNNNLQGALSTLDSMKETSAITSYLHAIIAARNNNKFATKSYLEEALQKNPSLKSYADNDLELSILR